MPKPFMFALAVAAATLGTVPLAQAQMAGQQMGDHRPGQNHDNDRGRDRPMRPPEPRNLVSRAQSQQLRSATFALDNQIVRAYQTRRITPAQTGALRNQVKGVQQQYWAKERDGMTRDDYRMVNSSLGRLRAEFQRVVAQNDHRRR